MTKALYVHIPFCMKRCVYCDFVSGIYDPEKADAYIKALKKEISSIPEKTPLSTLFIGGGTPTALSAPALTDLIDHIFSHFSFTPDFEATIEANPGTVDREKLQAIYAAGMNRISIGIQSFHDDELLFLGRLHTAKEAEQAVHLARDAGFNNIGVDLIYAIPGQNIVSWRDTIEKALKLKPKHISAYELTIEEGTLLHKFIDASSPPPPSKSWFSRLTGFFRNRITKPPEGLIVEMYNQTIDYLKDEGYVHYEISNFAKPGFICKHNLNYWDRGPYYGAGLGAHSFMNSMRSHNTESLEEYLKIISEGQRPVIKTEHITEDKSIAEAIFLGMRKTEGIDIPSFTVHYGKDICTLYEKQIKDMQDAGLLEKGNNALRLTRKGILLSNEVFARFI
ncbi:MAG: radical SAM family heme chaperone HemW [Nitrospiraceae bacterium]|nr:MAG: radical SAM family heme chaperone HemW [Nitrospiraceae bacterium]